jgi:hypothetical protein
VRRIFSELVPIEELARSPALDALAARRIQLIVAVQPGDDPRELLSRARDLDLSIGLWPLLHDHDGRWLSRHNAPRFEKHARALIDTHRADAILIDVEPPIADARKLLRGNPRALIKSLRAQDSYSVPHLVRELGSACPEVIVAIPPPIAPMWERIYGIAELEPDQVTICAMLYTSLFEGYSRRLVDRAVSRDLLASWSRVMRIRFGKRACIGLGCVGKGALGDERTYRDVHELEEDVAIATSIVDDIAVFDLSGVLARAPIERWLDTLRSG